MNVQEQEIEAWYKSELSKRPFGLHHTQEIDDEYKRKHTALIEEREMNRKQQERLTRFNEQYACEVCDGPLKPPRRGRPPKKCSRCK